MGFQFLTAYGVRRAPANNPLGVFSKITYFYWKASDNSLLTGRLACFMYRRPTLYTLQIAVDFLKSL